MTSRTTACINWGIGILGLTTVLACVMVQLFGRDEVPAPAVYPGGVVFGLVPAFGVVRGLRRHAFDRLYDWVWLVLSFLLAAFFLLPTVASLWELAKLPSG